MTELVIGMGIGMIGTLIVLWAVWRVVLPRWIVRVLDQRYPLGGEEEGDEANGDG